MVQSLLNLAHISSLNANSPLREGRRNGIPQSFVNPSVIIIIIIIAIFISFTRRWRRLACPTWFLFLANFTFSYIILYRKNLYNQVIKQPFTFTNEFHSACEQREGLLELVLKQSMLTFALAIASANIFWFIPQSFGTFDWHFLWQFMLHARRKKLYKLINS